MIQTRLATMESPNGHANGHANGYANGYANGTANGHAGTTSLRITHQTTDRSRWRLLNESGRHTWHYLKSDKEIKEWPQTIADKYHTGQPTVGQTDRVQTRT
jgi:lanosterol synthase